MSVATAAYPLCDILEELESREPERTLTIERIRQFSAAQLKCLSGDELTTLVSAFEQHMTASSPRDLASFQLDCNVAHYRLSLKDALEKKMATRKMNEQGGSRLLYIASLPAIDILLRLFQMPDNKQDVKFFSAEAFEEDVLGGQLLAKTDKGDRIVLSPMPVCVRFCFDLRSFTISAHLKVAESPRGRMMAAVARRARE